MKYAKFSDDFLSYFRLDDNGETLVLTDKRGYTRAVELLPYEERPQGDLISRSVLKKMVYAEFGNSNLTDAFNNIIDNAPTVSDRYEEGYAQGYIDGSTGADMKGGAE